MKPLNPQELQEAHKEISEWQIVDDMLITVLEFEDFEQSMHFVNHVAELAESHGHHPRIIVEYNTVQLELSTHDADDSITQKDVDLAKAIDGILSSP